MDLPTITMDRTEARERFLEYRREVRARHGAEDAEIMRGYQALSRGHALLTITDALKATGLDEHGRPKIAIMRADHPWVWFRREGTNVMFSATQAQSRERWWNKNKHPDKLRFNGVYPQSQGSGGWYAKHRALVPVIPPRLRPANDLRNYHLLWEPSWEEMPPPPDPMLLKRVSHDLYAVLAVWDLTEVELSVLGRRFAQP